MKRREFVEKLGAGSAGIVAAAALGDNLSAAGQHNHDRTQIDGPLASVTISFGAWLTNPPLDVFTTPGNTRLSNLHRMVPYDSKIKAGGTVNFIISGLHQILVYGPGTTPESVNENLLVFNVPNGFPGFIDDPANRVYRGQDPRPLPLNRVEVVTLAEPGRYLIACGIRSHFLDGMYGYVNVLG